MVAAILRTKGDGWDMLEDWGTTKTDGTKINQNPKYPIIDLILGLQTWMQIYPWFTGNQTRQWAMPTWKTPLYTIGMEHVSMPCWFNECILVHVWSFPKIGLLPNHPILVVFSFYKGCLMVHSPSIFHFYTIQLLGYPHDYGTPQQWLVYSGKPRSNGRLTVYSIQYTPIWGNHHMNPFDKPLAFNDIFHDKSSILGIPPCPWKPPTMVGL